MDRVRAAATLLAFAFLNGAFAAPFAVQVGEARIGLDAPPGFADTTFTGSPRLQELAEALTSPANRILVFAISDGDLRKFTFGDPPEFRRYMIAFTPRQLERERVSPQKFSEMAEAALREMGERVPPGTNLGDYFDKQPPGRSSVLGEPRRDAEVLSVVAAMRLQPRSRSQQQYALSTNSLILLRGKAVGLFVYGAYESPADLEWIRGITTRWIDILRHLNAP